MLYNLFGLGRCINCISVATFIFKKCSPSRACAACLCWKPHLIYLKWCKMIKYVGDLQSAPGDSPSPINNKNNIHFIFEYSWLCHHLSKQSISLLSSGERWAVWLTWCVCCTFCPAGMKLHDISPFWFISYFPRIAFTTEVPKANNQCHNKF